MKTFPELKIKAKKSDLINLLDSLKQKQSDSYAADQEKNEDYAKNTFNPIECTAVFTTKDPGDFGATIFMVISDDELRIANIIPSTVSSLGIENYGKVLRRFFTDFINPELTPVFNVKLTGDTVEMSELINPTTYEALNKWASICNPTNPLGSGYSDFFNEFIIQSYRHNDELSYEMLEKWLVEDKGWNPDYLDEQISKIGLAYENGLELLKQYGN